MAHEIDIHRVSADLAKEAPAKDASASRDRLALNVTDVRQDGPYYRIWLDAPIPFRSRHIAPGQYITARFDGSRHRFLVLANSPGETLERGYELLVEPNEDLAPVLETLGPGHQVIASIPEGEGFPFSLAHRRVTLVATGSGIAGIRPLLAHWTAEPSDRPLSATLLYEEEAGESHAYRAELTAWAEQAWLEVQLVTHEPGTPFVAELLAYESLNDESEVLLCGAPAMIAAVSGRALDIGLRADQIHTNI